MTPLGAVRRPQVAGANLSGTVQVNSSGAIEIVASGVWSGVRGTATFVGDDLGDDFGNFSAGTRVSSFTLNFEQIQFVGDDLGDDRAVLVTSLAESSQSGTFGFYIDDIIIGANVWQFSRGRGLLLPSVQ